METDTLVDRVYERLKMRILRQEYSYGQKLNLTTLAKEFNVSNTPLREAISRLETVGLVKIVPYRGASVRGISPPEVAEAYDVRIALETLAARLAVRHLTSEMFIQIDARHRQYEQAFDKGDVVTADIAFHAAIAQASQNRPLIDFLEMLSDWIKIFMQARQPPPREPTVLIEEHRLILDALRDKDEGRAEEAMKYHLTTAKEDLIQHLVERHEGASVPD